MYRYGYHAPRRPQQGFYFSRPKFEVYPYSQHDIPPARYQPQYHTARPGYASSRVSPQHYHHQHQAPPQQLHTSVTIEQSHGFEITPEEYNGYAVGGALQQGQQYYNYQQQQSQYENEQGPVIVLRIPGPAKYAAHLQALLQKYLEVRAEQYIAELQQQEQIQYEQQAVHQQVSQEPQYISHSTTVRPFNGPEYLPKGTQTTVENFVTPIPEHSVSPPRGFQTPNPHEQSISDSPAVYSSHSVYENHQVVPDHEEQQGHIEYGVPNQSATPPQLDHDDGPHQDYQSYTQSYSYDTAPQIHDDHHNAELHSEQPAQYVYEEPNVPISENYPSSKHTQVFFRQHHSTPEPQTSHQSQAPQLFQIPINVQQSQSVYHQSPGPVYQSSEQVYNSPAPQYDYSPAEDHSMQYQQVSITPKSHRGAPYNYHAHPTENPHAKRNANQFSSKISTRLRKVMMPAKSRTVIRVEEESDE